MILLAGAFELIPLVAVLLLGVAFSLAGTAGWGAASLVIHSPWAAAAGLVAFGLAAGVASEAGLRRRAARRRPGWVVSLEALGASEVAPRESVGGKALQLGRLGRLGAPVPAALVLTSELVERIRAAAGKGRPRGDAWTALPAPARRALDAFLAGAKGRVIARASFVDPASLHSYAGAFPAVRDIDPKDRDAVLGAVLALLGSSDDEVAREYRRLRRAGPPVARAVILQRQLDADAIGAVASRGRHGRADTVTVDVARRRSPVRSYDYDLVDGTAQSIGDAEKFDTPAWMHRLAVLAVTLEQELGGPVHFEFALEAGQPYLLDVRRVAAEARKTWLHAAPLDATLERKPRFAEELRGGLPMVRRVLGETLARAGAKGGVADDEVRFVDGLVYVDAEVVRRALATIGLDALLRGGARATIRAVPRVARRPIPRVPSVTEVTASAWQELRAWHGRHLLGAAQERLELVARLWLVGLLLRLADGTGAAVEDRRGHPAIRWVLSRRARAAQEEAARKLEVLEQAESELGSAVARVLARGAEGWDAMFKGDRHLHATLEEIDEWHRDTGGREKLEAEWRARRAAFEERRGAPTVPRVHRPPLPDAAGTRSLSSRLAAFPVVPGTARGPAVLVSGHDRGLSAGAILVVADGRSELCAHLHAARGVVLLTGGAASPVALLAAELGIPVVVCPGGRALATRDVTIDGATGTVTLDA